MSKRPWVPIYVGDLLADTMTFEPDEFGAYMKILFHYWITEEPMTLKEMQKASGLSIYRFKNCSDLLLTKFSVDNGKYFNRRMKLEIIKAIDVSNKRSKAGKKAHPAIAPRKPVLKPTLLQLQSLKDKNHCSSDDGFERWWAAWPVGHKAGKIKCKKTWKTKKPDPDVLIADVENRKANDRRWIPNKDGETFIPNPATYLNQERWDDDIQPVKSKSASLPKSDDALEQFAIEKGLHKRGCAPQNIRNMYQYRQWIESQL